MKLIISFFVFLFMAACGIKTNSVAQPQSPNPPVSKAQADQLICKMGYLSSMPDQDGKLLGQQTKQMELDYEKYKSSSPIQIFSFEDSLSIFTVSILTENLKPNPADPNANIGKSVVFEIQHKNKANTSSKYPESYFSAKTKMGWNLFNVFIGPQKFGEILVDRASMACTFSNK